MIREKPQPPVTPPEKDAYAARVAEHRAEAERQLRRQREIHTWAIREIKKNDRANMRAAVVAATGIFATLAFVTVLELVRARPSLLSDLWGSLSPVFEPWPWEARVLLALVAVAAVGIMRARDMAKPEATASP